MLPEIIPTAEPFFFPGNQKRTACLLIHGFTGAPKEMRWMGEYLASQGYTVLGVRLAGHASSPEDMTRMKWSDWLLSIEDGYHMLRGSWDQIFLIGLSMGAILSLTFASKYPVSGVIAMSCPYELPPNPLLPFAGAVKLAVRYVDKGKPDWQNLDAAKDHIEYPKFPVAGVIQLKQLLEVMRSRLPQVTSPVLLVHGSHDSTVPVEHTQAICDLLGSQIKSILYLENSGHIVTREPDRQQLFEAARDFINKISPDLS